MPRRYKAPSLLPLKGEILGLAAADIVQRVRDLRFQKDEVAHGGFVIGFADQHLHLALDDQHKLFSAVRASSTEPPRIR